MKKKKGVVVFLVLIIAMLLLGYYSYGIVKGTAAKDNEKGIKLGLDLAGGVSITYQVKGDETPSAEDMKDTVYKLQKRVETYSTEAEVYQVSDGTEPDHKRRGCHQRYEELRGCRSTCFPDPKWCAETGTRRVTV